MGQVTRESKRALKVLVIKYVVTGLQLYAQSIVRPFVALAKRGHHVTYVVASTPELAREATDVLDLKFKMDAVLLPRLVPVLSPIIFQLVLLRRVLKSLRIWDVIILDSMSVVALFPVLALLRLGKAGPILFLRVYSNPVEPRGRLESAALLLLDVLSMKVAAALVDRMFFISPMMGESYCLRLRLPRNKIGVMPSSVDTSRFRPAARDSTLRKEIGPSNELVVLHHGDLTKGRGVMELVKAFNILRTESFKAVLILLGSGSLVDEIKRYVRANQLEEIVRVHGPVDYSEVPRYIAACDAGIVPLPNHPWWRNQCPTKLLECLAMNKPVIVSNIPGNRWIVGTAPVAVYLNGTSAHEIADGIRAFSKVRNTLDWNVGAQIASNFSAEKIADLIEHEIVSVMTNLRRLDVPEQAEEMNSSIRKRGAGVS
jgi:glycosyltransferase involved in cell wall biosynthesis